MNPWYYLFGFLGILALLIIGMIVCIVFLIRSIVKKSRKKPIVIAAAVNVVLLSAVLLFNASHATYYKYNDWAILNSNIHTVEQKYGEFDLGEIHDNHSGRAGYYIYTDNGPIMPDHLPHYYYMEYDEQGIVRKVYDGVYPGG
ncbi:MAG: hypothetical protein ACI4JZ_09925 [Oscillospiraceae bacterium]